MHGRAAWIGTGREGGGRKERGWRGRDAAQQLHTQQVQPTAGDWECGLRTEEVRESRGEVYKRNPNGFGPNKYSPVS